MENPWEEVSWTHPYAECDKDIIFAKKYNDKLQICDTLPEPYVGNLNSHVVCLNGNPGMRDNHFECKEIFTRELIATLNHSCTGFMWLSEKLKPTKHLGIGWWEQITKSLPPELRYNPNMFVLEYFPYHSAKMFNFPNLPSDVYRNYLLRQAMDDGKLIIIMRSKSRWFRIKEDNIGKFRYKSRFICQ